MQKKSKGRKRRVSNKYTKDLSANLSDLIEKKRSEGINHKQISDEIDAADGALSNWANDVATPNLDSLIKLAKYFDVSIDWLIGLDDFEKIENKHVNARDLGLSEKAIEVLKSLNKGSNQAENSAVNNEKAVIAVINMLIENEGAKLCGTDDYGFARYDNKNLAQIITAIKDYLIATQKEGIEYLITSDGYFEPVDDVNELVEIDSNEKLVSSIHMDSFGRIPGEDYLSVDSFNSEEIVTTVLINRICKRVEQLKTKLNKEGKGI